MQGPYTEKAGGEKVPVRLLCIIRVLDGGGYPDLPFSRGRRESDQRSFFMYCRNGASLSSTITLWPSANEAR